MASFIQRAAYLLLGGLAVLGGPAGATSTDTLSSEFAAPPAAERGLDARRGQGLVAPASSVLDLREQPSRILTLDLTRDANDIWDRIRRGFGMPDLDSDAVTEQQVFYLNRPGFLKKVFERGGRYLYHIVDELERRGMPTELALLPMVESSYNPMAYSRAHASGLWQFIPSTGRNYRLTQDKWLDERRDVVASTAAALDYLQSIYDMHGDWQLALASYNWGEGAVGRAVRRNLDEGLPAEYQHLRMPEETRNYVPKLQALKNIVARPELFAFELPYVPNSAHFVTVEAPAGIDLGTAARLAGMTPDEFIALNPGFNRPVITTDGRSLVVPVEHAERLQEGLATHFGAANRWRTHELKRGETLAAVARKYGVTLLQLQQLNGLSARSRVSPGFTLLVPDGADLRGALEVAHLFPNAHVPLAQPTPAKAKAKKPQKPGRKAASKPGAKTAKKSAATRSAKSTATAPKSAAKKATVAKTAPK